MKNKKLALEMIIDTLRKEGSIRLLVKGGSMSPTIRDGAIVKIRNSKLETRNKKEKIKEEKKSGKAKMTGKSCTLSLVACRFKPGTVVCYKVGDWFLIHRIKKIDEKTGLITVEGDSRDSVVHKIKRSAIIGIVEESICNKILRIPAVIMKQVKQKQQRKQVKKEKYQKPEMKSEKIFETSTLACGKCKPGPIIQPSCTGFPKKS